MSQSSRDLRTPISQVFGHVEKGTDCRICGRNVDDGRAVYCSDYCRNLARAVMSLLNWGGVRRRVIERDEETCQACGFDYNWVQDANDRIRARIQSELPQQPHAPLDEIDDWDDEEWSQHFDEMGEWQQQRKELRARYGNPDVADRQIEVDHITPISEGGHPFDPGNLQTLCDECHQEKTSHEAAKRSTPSQKGIQNTLFEYVSDGGEGR